MPTGIYKHKLHSKETKIKIGLSNSISQKGKHLSKKTITKLSNIRKGIRKSNVHKNKLSNSLKGHIVTEETRKKISKANKGRKQSEETKEKKRIAAFDYVKRTRNILYPCVGHNEKQILDKLEVEIGYKIIRQYKVEGYHLDGYIPELNIVIEVDERPKIRERDLERQKIIEKELNCKFIRIEDFN